MNYFDVVLFSPPSRMINHYRPPVGLLYIGGYLTHKGLKVKIIDIPLKEQIRTKEFFDNVDKVIDDVHQKMISEFKQIKTKVVGISCYTPEYFEVVKLAKDIKKIDNSVKIIVGGIHSTFYPQDFFDEDTGVDICVLGEGELTMYDLCQHILNNDKKDLNEINGIAYFDSSSRKVVCAPKRILSENLDDISFPDYSLIDMEYYTNANPYAIRGCFLRSMYLLATRGCPSQCTFCVAKKLREFTSSSRVRSAKSLIRELVELKEKYSIDSFYFIDDLFTINKDNVKEFCSMLKTNKLNLLWGCSSKVVTLNEDVIKAMSESGCVQIDFGVERGSDKALRLLKKGQNVSIIKNIFGYCHTYGIRTFANMLTNLPEETEEDLNDILKLLDEINSEIVSINIFTPYPGTEIYDNSKFKYKKEEYAYLTRDITWLIKTYPERFRYSSHNINLEEWVVQHNKQYNKIFPNLKFYLSGKYLNVLLKSKEKMNYLKQFNLLFREFLNQKF
ncbi:MAG: radical SAM protein [Candidatus Firestonebacteria bacterium]